MKSILGYFSSLLRSTKSIQRKTSSFSEPFSHCVKQNRSRSFWYVINSAQYLSKIHNITEQRSSYAGRVNVSKILDLYDDLCRRQGQGEHESLELLLRCHAFSGAFIPPRLGQSCPDSFLQNCLFMRQHRTPEQSGHSYTVSS